MTIVTSDITFFIGSGASAPFGIPTMKSMTEQFGNTLKKGEKEVYEEITKIITTKLRSISKEFYL